VLVLTITPALYLILERAPERRRLRRRALGLQLAGPADRSLVGR
jgi:hypothetical protein